MKKYQSIFFAVITLLSLSLLSGCERWKTRTWGGTSTLEIAPDEQLVGLTWKDTSLWALTYKPATKECFFRESSAAGKYEGTVVIPKCTPAQTMATVAVASK